MREGVRGERICEVRGGVRRGIGVVIVTIDRIESKRDVSNIIDTKVLHRMFAQDTQVAHSLTRIVISEHVSSRENHSTVVELFSWVVTHTNGAELGCRVAGMVGSGSGVSV